MAKANCRRYLMNNEKKFLKDICKVAGHDEATTIGDLCERCDPFAYKLQNEINKFVGMKISQDTLEHIEVGVRKVLLSATEEIVEFRNITTKYEYPYLTIEVEIYRDGQWQILQIRTA